MNKNNNKFSFIFSSIIVIGVAIFLVILFRSINKETKIDLNDNYFEVKGLYGANFNYDDVTLIELKDTLPEVTYKTNGADFGEAKKGNFDVSGLGNCKLYILTKNGPFIYLKINDKYVIINYRDKNKTEQLYNGLSAHMK
ncbi:MAG TPA: hypothetical protein VN258_18425 [Mobilitalea sp.]|nr:hypothetical protein [Mobilitalea sp.]